jgi:hypothetical protein
MIDTINFAIAGGLDQGRAKEFLASGAFANGVAACLHSKRGAMASIPPIRTERKP